MSGNFSRAKGARGHAKAIKYLGARGWIGAVWPHMRHGTDAFGFADIVAVNGTNYTLIQVKNTRAKPTHPALVRFLAEVKGAGIPLRNACFMWFAHRATGPVVWLAEDILTNKKATQPSNEIWKAYP